jgi:hypothetical protein
MCQLSLDVLAPSPRASTARSGSAPRLMVIVVTGVGIAAIGIALMLGRGTPDPIAFTTAAMVGMVGIRSFLMAAMIRRLGN